MGMEKEFSFNSMFKTLMDHLDVSADDFEQESQDTISDAITNGIEQGIANAEKNLDKSVPKAAHNIGTVVAQQFAETIASAMKKEFKRLGSGAISKEFNKFLNDELTVKRKKSDNTTEILDIATAYDGRNKDVYDFANKLNKRKKDILTEVAKYYDSIAEIKNSYNKYQSSGQIDDKNLIFDSGQVSKNYEKFIKKNNVLDKKLQRSIANREKLYSAFLIAQDRYENGEKDLGDYSDFSKNTQVLKDGALMVKLAKELNHMTKEIGISDKRFNKISINSLEQKVNQLGTNMLQQGVAANYQKELETMREQTGKFVELVQREFTSKKDSQNVLSQFFKDLKAESADAEKKVIKSTRNISDVLKKNLRDPNRYIKDVKNLSDGLTGRNRDEGTYNIYKKFTEATADERIDFSKDNNMDMYYQYVGEIANLIKQAASDVNSSLFNNLKAFDDGSLRNGLEYFLKLIENTELKNFANEISDVTSAINVLTGKAPSLQSQKPLSEDNLKILEKEQEVRKKIKEQLERSKNLGIDQSQLTGIDGAATVDQLDDILDRITKINNEREREKTVNPIYESALEQMGDVTDFDKDDWDFNRKMLNKYADAVRELQKQINKTTDAKILDDLNKDLQIAQIEFIALYEKVKTVFDSKLNKKGSIKASTIELYDSLVPDDFNAKQRQKNKEIEARLQKQAQEKEEKYLKTLTSDKSLKNIVEYIYKSINNGKLDEYELEDLGERIGIRFGDNFKEGFLNIVKKMNISDFLEIGESQFIDEMFKYAKGEEGLFSSKLKEINIDKTPLSFGEEESEVLTRDKLVELLKRKYQVDKSKLRTSDEIFNSGDYDISNTSGFMDSLVEMENELDRIVENILEQKNKLITGLYDNGEKIPQNGLDFIANDIKRLELEYEQCLNDIYVMRQKADSGIEVKEPKKTPTTLPLFEDEINTDKAQQEQHELNEELEQNVNSSKKLLDLLYEIKNVDKSSYSKKTNLDWVGYYNSREEAIADDIKLQKTNLHSSLNLILNEDKDALSALEQEANKLKSSLQPVQDMVSKISSNSSIKYLDENKGSEKWYKEYAIAYKEIDDRLGELYHKYELTNEELEEYITLQVKAEKIMDSMIVHCGGIKRSGSKNRYDLEQLIEKDFAKDLGLDPEDIYRGLFGNITNALYEGRMSLYDDNGEKKSLRYIVGNILGYKGSNFSDGYGAEDDTKNLRKINTVLTYIKNNATDIENTDFSEKINDALKLVGRYEKKVSEGQDVDFYSKKLENAKNDLQELISLQERLNIARGIQNEETSSKKYNLASRAEMPDASKFNIVKANQEVQAYEQSSTDTTATVVENNKKQEQSYKDLANTAQQAADNIQQAEQQIQDSSSVPDSTDSAGKKKDTSTDSKKKLPKSLQFNIEDLDEKQLYAKILTAERAIKENSSTAELWKEKLPAMKEAYEILVQQRKEQEELAEAARKENVERNKQAAREAEYNDRAILQKGLIGEEAGWNITNRLGETQTQEIVYRYDKETGDLNVSEMPIITNFEQLSKLIMKTDEQIANLEVRLNSNKAAFGKAYDSKHLEAVIASTKKYLKILEDEAKKYGDSDDSADYALNYQNFLAERTKNLELIESNKQDKLAITKAKAENKHSKAIDSSNSFLSRQLNVLKDIQFLYDKEVNPNALKALKDGENLNKLRAEQAAIEKDIVNLRGTVLSQEQKDSLLTRIHNLELSRKSYTDELYGATDLSPKELNVSKAIVTNNVDNFIEKLKLAGDYTSSLRTEVETFKSTLNTIGSSNGITEAKHQLKEYDSRFQVLRTQEQARQKENKKANAQITEEYNKNYKAIEKYSEAQDELNKLIGQQIKHGKSEELTSNIVRQTKEVIKLRNEAEKATAAIIQMYGAGEISSIDKDIAKDLFNNTRLRKTDSFETLAAIRRDKDKEFQYAGRTKLYEEYLSDMFKDSSIEDAMFKSASVDSTGKGILTFLELVGDRARETKVYLDDVNEALDQMKNGQFDFNAHKTISKWRNATEKDFDGNAYNKVNDRVNAYEQLIKTEDKYQKLSAKVEMEKATTSEIAEFNRLKEVREKYNNIISESIEKLNEEERAVYNSKQAQLQDLQSRYEKQKEDSQLTKKAYMDAYKVNNPQEDVARAISVVNDKMNTLSKKDGVGYSDYFARQKKEVDALTESLKKGVFTVEEYNKRVGKITSDLDNTIAFIEPNAIDNGRAALEGFIKSMEGAEFTGFKELGNGLYEATGKLHKHKGAVEDISITYSSFNGKIAQTKSVLKDVDTSASIFFTKLKKRFGSLIQYLMTFGSFYEVVGIIRQGVNVVTDLDSALTEMRKVSDESISSLKKFQDESFDVAHNIGSTAKQIQQSAADYMRLGYSLDTASKLAEDANIYANVGDMDIQEATEHMVSSIQAWKSEFENEVEASEAIINRYNEIGNNFAITSADIGSAMERSAAALKAGGNTLNESLGLITAGKFCLKFMETYFYRTYLIAGNA